MTPARKLILVSTPRYSVRVTKDHLVFSAGHFITFNGNICERIHGHNWRVEIELGGPLDENSYVFDFIAVRDTAQSVVDRLDHRMLLPTAHPTIQVTTSETEVEARFESRRWVFPRDECVLLPVANTTAELIAQWFADQLLTQWTDSAIATLDYLQVGIEENFGQWARCRLDQPGRTRGQ